MKRLAYSLVSIAFVSVLVIGATNAYFSDQSTAAGNTFAAGTVELDLNNRDSLTNAYSVSNIAPGDRKFAGQIVLKNAGSVDGHAWLEISNVRTSVGGTLGNLVWASFHEDHHGHHSIYGGTHPIKISEGKKIDLFDLNARDKRSLDLYAIWPNRTPAIDNPAQGETITFDVVFHLDQKMRR